MGWQILHEETAEQRQVSVAVISEVLKENLKKIINHGEGGTMTDWAVLVGIWGLLSEVFTQLAQINGYSPTFSMGKVPIIPTNSILEQIGEIDLSASDSEDSEDDET